MTAGQACRVAADSCAGAASGPCGCAWEGGRALADRLSNGGFSIEVVLRGAS